MGRPISNINNLKDDYDRLTIENKYMKFIINDAAVFFDDHTYMTKEELWKIINKWKR